MGIGVNVNMPRMFLAALIGRRRHFLPKPESFPVEEVEEKVAAAFSRDLDTYFLHGFSSFIEEYRARIRKDIASSVLFHDNKKIWEGAFEAIEDDGAITLVLPDKSRKTFLVGEILWEKKLE